MNRYLIIMLLCICACLCGCATNPVTGRSELMLVSESQEVQMGKELYPNALWGDIGGGGEYRDAKAKAYLGDIVYRIHAISHRPNLPVTFAIQNSSVPNAWAVPGYVVITRGLVAALQSEAEYAYVMGHEMGHVSARHSASQISKGMVTQIGLGLAGAALSGTNYGDAALSLGALAGNLIMMKFSRTDELEADRLGLAYMTRLGYHPKNAILAHQSLQRASNEYQKTIGKNSQEGSVFGNLLSTHPRTEDRIAEMRETLTRLGPINLSGDGTFRERYLQMTADLRSMHSVYTNFYDKATRALQQGNVQEADALIYRAILIAPGQSTFHALRGFIKIRQRDHAEADRSFAEALRLDRDYQPAYRGLGTLAYLRGDYARSINYLKNSVSLFPQDVFSHYFLGLSQFRSGNYRAALPSLALFAQAHPNHPEIHGIMGLTYEHLGDPNAAYQEYAKQLQVAPSSPVGKQASQRMNVIRSRLR